MTLPMSTKLCEQVKFLLTFTISAVFIQYCVTTDQFKSVNTQFLSNRVRPELKLFRMSCTLHNAHSVKKKRNPF